MKIIQQINISFRSQNGIYWANLSRFTNLLIVLNITLFFLSELVTKHGYYYTYYSLFALGIVDIGLLIPIGLLGRLWYYCIFLIIETVGIHFLVVSIWYWIVVNKV